jgi:pre-mRNA cleavage complex 2 protein Pcf11
MKLPAFYLLDAISKNVYDPYARHFAAFVIPLFLETYGQVDENTRSKMEEMLLTWRTGSPNGKELFGVPPQVAIERGVWGDGGSSHNVSLNVSLSIFQMLMKHHFRRILVFILDLAK